MYATPQISGGEDFKYPLNKTDFTLAIEHTKQPNLLGCDENISKFITIVMREKGLSLPMNALEAKSLLLATLEELNNVT